MHKTVITVELSLDSIEKAKQKLEKYKKWLDDKLDQLVSELAAQGLEILNAYIGTISDEYTEGDISAEVSAPEREGGTVKAKIYLNGSQAVFIEFGAGVIFNGPVGTVTHPKGAQYGFSIGSWSYGPGGKHHAAQPYGWWKPNGEHTYGTPAFAPMWETAQDLEQTLVEIARSVFV